MEQKNYYVVIDGRKKGPYSKQELLSLQLDSSVLVWSKGMSEWKPLREIHDLREAWSSIPPPFPGEKNEFIRVKLQRESRKRDAVKTKRLQKKSAQLIVALFKILVVSFLLAWAIAFLILVGTYPKAIKNLQTSLAISEMSNEQYQERLRNAKDELRLFRETNKIILENQTIKKQSGFIPILGCDEYYRGMPSGSRYKKEYKVLQVLYGECELLERIRYLEYQLENEPDGSLIIEGSYYDVQRKKEQVNNYSFIDHLDSRSYPQPIDFLALLLFYIFLGGFILFFGIKWVLVNAQ